MGIVITTSWDDGNKADFKIARLLKKYGLEGTFYIPIKYRHRNLNNREIFRLSRKFEIGSHGLTHRRLIFLNKNEKVKEIVESKKLLEKIICKEVKCFAYPFGVYDRKSLEYVKNTGYVFARTTGEFCFEKPKNPLLSSISLELSNKISRVLSPKCFGYIVRGCSWTKIAEMLFDKMPKNGVFHIFGHSWQIEKNNDWNNLEKLFEHITNRKGLVSLNNSDLVKLK